MDEGRLISHFRIVKKLGGGGMGVVYKARDERLSRWVALKFLPLSLADSPSYRARLEREASAASALDHPNICTIHEIDETEDGQLFIAMAFYEGETLKKKIERDVLSLESSLNIALQAAEGLAAAHRQGILHRDIKPANLMITREGTVKIVDFGLARREDQTRITVTGTVVGTPGYMSPEQVEGKDSDRRSDVWALGVVLYQMLSGQLPFGDHDTLDRASLIPITDRVPNVPEDLDEVLEKSLQPDPDDRYQDAFQLAAALRRVRETLGFASSSTMVTEAWIPPEPMKTEPSPTRRRWAVIAAVALVLALAGWLFMTQWTGPDPPIRSQEAQNLFDQARRYERQGYTKAKLEAAEDLYRKALEKEPGDPQIQADLASLLSRMQLRYPKPGRAEEIEQLVEQSLALDQQIAAAWVAQGTLDLIAGDTEAAEQAARQAVLVDPENHTGYVLLGDALIVQGQVEEGLDQQRLAVEVGRGFVGARESLGYSLMNLGQFDEAAGQYEKVLEYDPYSPTALGNLSAIYQYQGRDSDAVPLLNQLLKAQPEDDIATGNLGLAYMNLDRMDEAIAAFERAHELAPNKPAHILNLGDCYEKLGDLPTARGWYERAIASFDQALEAGGPRVRLLAPQAVCFAKLGHFEEAIAAVEESVELAGPATVPLFYAAQVYSLAGNDEKTYEFTRLSLEAGHSRDWFRLEPAFAAYQGVPAFEELLEHTVTAR